MMDERDLQAIPQLQQLSIWDEHEPEAQSMIAESSAEFIAEAADTARLHDLLHRTEYRPIAVVRFGKSVPPSVRVYFRLLD
jgi:hypothetical protein